MRNKYTDKINKIHRIFTCFGIMLMLFILQSYLPKQQIIKSSSDVKGIEVKNNRELVIESSQEIRLEKVELKPEACKVTWYGNEFNGRLSANGDVFNEMGMTAASNTLPFGTKVLVMYQERSVEVTITDRGGFTHCFDLSKGAFMQLAPLEKGVLYVNYAIL